MITEKALREVELMIEAARLGGRPALPLELRETLAELVSYYKANLPDLPRVLPSPAPDEAPFPKFARQRPDVPFLEVSEDGETWVPVRPRQLTDHNFLQLVEKSVGEGAPAPVELEARVVTRYCDAATGRPFPPPEPRGIPVRFAENSKDPT